MKLIKIIMGCVITLSLIFFGTGFVVDKIEYSNTITINKPVNVVFSELSSVNNMKNWYPEIKSIEVLKETPQKIGSIYNITLTNGGQQTKMRQKIKEYIVNQKITYRFISESLYKTDSYSLTSKEGKTVLVQCSDIAPNSFLLSCTFPWFKGKLKEVNQQYLNNFKTLIENK